MTLRAAPQGPWALPFGGDGQKLRLKARGLLSPWLPGLGSPGPSAHTGPVGRLCGLRARFGELVCDSDAECFPEASPAGGGSAVWGAPGAPRAACPAVDLLGSVSLC